MSENSVHEIIKKFNSDPTRLLDMLLSIQKENGYITSEFISVLAQELNLSKVDIEQTITFYHFLRLEPKGEYSIYLNDSVVSKMMGMEKIASQFEKETGIKFGEVTEDGLIGLFYTSCIGMSDQEPAAIINEKIFTNLTTFRVKEIILAMKQGKPVEKMYCTNFGGGKNSSPLIKSIVRNNIRRSGPLLSLNYNPGQVLNNKLTLMTPEEVIDEVKMSHLRGRGGAGFPTGLKWQFCRRAKGEKKYIFCNADEGEPGTFKDRVLLTEKAEMVFEGMTVSAYAVGATEGILYLRYEYKYMEKYLEHVLQEFRDKNWLGNNISGIAGFNFDIRIQYGSGAYICGEESSLIESAEGKRGEPRPRPPFPVEKGYLGFPTIINNVETLCSAVSILQNGGSWYRELGTDESTGTKILSISGDCRYPGIYELEWGFSVNDILEMSGAENTKAVQVGGPSGALIPPSQFDRLLCYSDLATGGSLIIFNNSRDLLKDVVMNFTEFFIEESCGSCVPCRNIPALLKNKLEKIFAGHGTRNDLNEMEEWSNIMQINRCGLGHTAANPVTSSLKNFRELYEELIQRNIEFDSGIDLASAVAESCEFVDRIPQL
ncbi:MAG: NAD(P)H-dependent oxidoreductase subunit E [Bacteroidales bacterium]|nr:NAD(P)H-dependent oxidoreductase subunit E [Bacteroidales bacterium]